MLTNLQKRKDGFTIIEVMIVIAIAGLIILVVLLAVPALQRGSRNTAIKNDASAVSGAIGEFQGANNGKNPTTVSADADGQVTVSKTGLTSTTGKVKAGTEVTSGTTDNLGTTGADTGKIRVVTGYKCNDAGTGLGSASTRSMAIIYNVETSGTPAKNCIEG